MKRFVGEMQIYIMYKIKLLSQRTTRVEIEAEDLMIRNLMVGHNQEIDLSSRKLENALMKITKHSRTHCMFQLGLLLK